jgi:nucleotide-binding universal stress UspA family protein
MADTGSMMLQLPNLLCPIDFSENSRHALSHAVTIGRWYGSRITALHVVEPGLTINPPILFADAARVTSRRASREELEACVREWLAPAASANLDADVVIMEGNPARAILECARTLGADLVVLGTHGRSGFERFMLGSTTEKVLRKAGCPVLTVPPPAAATSRLPLRRLLCAVDFSDSSLAGLTFAFSLAQESNARLTLLHVFEWPSDEASARRILETSEFHQRWEMETRQRLAALIADDVRNWCEPRARLAFGKAYQQILSVAEAEEVDLIVMGVHGRSALDLMLFGSTTNGVIRQATCPVLTLRA